MLQHILLVLAAVVVASTQAAAPITEAGMKTEATLLTNWGKFFNLYVYSRTAQRTGANVHSCPSLQLQSCRYLHVASHPTQPAITLLVDPCVPTLCVSPTSSNLSHPQLPRPHQRRTLLQTESGVLRRGLHRVEDIVRRGHRRWLRGFCDDLWFRVVDGVCSDYNAQGLL